MALRPEGTAREKEARAQARAQARALLEVAKHTDQADGGRQTEQEAGAMLLG